MTLLDILFLVLFFLSLWRAVYMIMKKDKHKVYPWIIIAASIMGIWSDIWVLLGDFK